MSGIEVIGFVLGVLGSVEQAIAMAQALHDRYRAYKLNPKNVIRLLSAYRTFAEELRMIEVRFHGKIMHLPPDNRAIFESHIRDMADEFLEARHTLEELATHIQSRGRVMRAFRAFSHSDECEELLEGLRRAKGLLFDINSFLSTAAIIVSVADEIKAGQKEQDCFRASFLPIVSPSEIILDFDGSNDDGSPRTYEGRVKKLVLEPGPSGNGLVSIQGMGGVGKSSILRRLGTDDDVKNHFSDGVYLIHLGMEATERTVFQQLCNILRASGAAESAAELRDERSLDEVLRQTIAWFEGKKCLFLVDDIWPRATKWGSALATQLVGLVGTVRRSAVVLTTRDLEIASKGVIVAVKPRDPLSPESRHILLTYAGAKDSEVEEETISNAFRELLNICGGLPVSLAAVGKGVKMLAIDYGAQRKMAWERYLKTLRVCRHDLLRRDVDGYTNLAVSFATSLALLEEKRDALPFSTSTSFAEMHKALCVLKKQGRAPVAMLQHLWDINDEQHAAFIAREFSRVGLANVEISQIGSDYFEVLKLHDLIHDFAVAEAQQRLSSFHIRLLEAYQAQMGLRLETEVGCREWWLPTLGSDHYIHKHLCRHLRMAGHIEELPFLLLCPQWVARQIQLNGILEVEDDFGEGIRALENAKAAPMDITEHDLLAISGAVRLSVCFFSTNQEELWFQLYNRLLGRSKSSSSVRMFLKRIERISPRPWLKSFTPCLGSSGGPLTRIITLENPIASIALAPGKNEVACGCENGSIVIVELSEGQTLSKWQAHGAVVTGLAFTSNGKSLVSGSWDCTAKVWDVETCALCATFEGHSDHITGVAIAPDDQCIVSSSNDDTAKVWHISTATTICSFKEHYGWVFCVTAMPDGQSAATGGDNGAVYIWNLETAQQVRAPLVGHTQWIRCLRVSADGKRIVTGSGFSVRVWDTEGSQLVGGVLEGHTDRIRSVDISANGERVASGSQDHSIRVWHSLNTQQDYELLEGHTDSVHGVRFLPGGQKLVSCSWDGTVRVWDLLSAAKQEALAQKHNAEVTFLDLSKHGTFIASSSRDKTVQLWDALSGSRVGNPFRGHLDDVTGVAITPDESTVVSVSMDKTVRLWESATGKQLCALEGHTRNINCVALTPDGSCAVTASDDLSVRVWDIDSKNGSHFTLTGHTHWVRKVFVSDDGKRIISISWIEVRVWDMHTRTCTKFIHKEDIHKLTRMEIFNLVKEPAAQLADELNSGICVPYEGRQILFQSGEHTGQKTLATLEADVTAWRFSGKHSMLYAGLASGVVAFLKLER